MIFNNSLKESNDTNVNDEIVRKKDPKLLFSSYGTEWYRTYGSFGDLSLIDMAVSASEDFHLVGSYILKYDKFGTFLWEESFGSGTPYAIATDNSNNVYVVGHYDDDMKLVKFSSDGTYQWTETYNPELYSRAYAIAVDSLDNIYVGCEGFTSDQWQPSNIFLVKYTTSGNLVWTQELDFMERDTCEDIIIDSSNNIILGGYSRDFSGDTYFMNAIYSSSGTLLGSGTWDTDSANAYCYGICLDSSNNIYLAGRGYYGSDEQTILVKFSSSASYMWNRKWGGTGWEGANDIYFASDGYLYLTGYTDSYGAGLTDFLILKYSTNGVLFEYDTWGGSQKERSYGIYVNSEGNIYLGGNTESYGRIGYSDMCLTKLNPVPSITINEPMAGQTYGKNAPDFDVIIEDSDLIEKYYRVNGGINRILSGSTGVIKTIGMGVVMDL